MEEQAKTYLTRKNYVAFSAAGFGQNLIYGVVNSYLLFFYTDIFAIGYTATTVLMFAARIFDALNDPVMGTLVDKTRTRFGKLRPYLMISPIPLFLFTVLIFLAPPFSTPMKVLYASITYILWGITYTICDVPFWGLPSVLTSNPNERIKFISFCRIFHSIGGAIPMVMLPLFSLIFGEQSTTSYWTMALVVGLLGAGLFSLAFFGSEERVENLNKAPTLKQCFTSLVKNKPLLTVVLANIAGFARQICLPAGLYIANYIASGIPSFLAPSMVNTLISAGWGVSLFIGMLLTTPLIKKFDYKTLAVGGACLGALGTVALLIIGLVTHYNMWSFLFLYILSGLPYGLVTNLNYAFISESIDYMEWKTGERTEGISVAMQTLMNKMMTALQVSLLPLILILVNFVEPSEGTPTPVQSEQTKLGFFLATTILCLAGWIANGVIMCFYKFTGKVRAQAYEELAARHAAKEGAAAQKGQAEGIAEA